MKSKKGKKNRIPQWKLNKMQRKIDNNVHLGQTISREFRRRLNTGSTPVDITYPSLIEKKTKLATQLLGQIYLSDPTKIPPWFRQNKFSSKNRLENPLGVGDRNDKINLNNQKSYNPWRTKCTNNFSKNSFYTVQTIFTCRKIQTISRRF